MTATKTTPWCHDMRGRTCLVTGATDGHGRAVAFALADAGADLVLLGRNPDKCETVRREIGDRTGRKPEVLLCDLLRRADVDRAAEEYLASDRPLHVLINNAGLVNLHRKTNEEGLEQTFAVNYLAMFQLSLRLFDRIRQSAPARIVNISSDTYKIANLELDDLQLERGYSVSQAYARSKLAIVYFTLELARRTEGSGVAVNAVDPGPVASNIAANNPGVLYSLARPMIRYLFPSAARAARTCLLVATHPELADETGGYWRSRKRRLRPLTKPDAALAEGLWQESVRLTGVDLATPGA
jgi:NAD(P)-dependent dehydrogenase (short-subunit alcohol dehydrogenase family)